MKKILLSSVFTLVGIFAMANESEVTDKQINTQTSEQITTVNIEEFIELVKSKKITIVQGVDFIFKDSCGGTWHVTGGEGWTMAEVMDALWNWDGDC